ncbi:MAG: helix-turn-helix transcriptional regulator [Actinomycetota bacterium]
MSLAVMGRDLRSRRRALGLTQAALAEAVGTRPVMVGRWERGEALPSIDEVIRLSEALDLDPAVAAGWSAVVLRSGPDPAPGAAASGPTPASAAAPAAPRGWSRRLPRLSSLVAVARRRQAALLPGDSGDNAVSPAPGPRLPGESYLDDPVEQRRYTLRWALTLLVLGALAIGLVWALGELREGWGAFLDLFRGRPPGSGLTRAVPWLLAGGVDS